MTLSLAMMVSFTKLWFAKSRLLRRRPRQKELCWPPVFARPVADMDLKGTWFKFSFGLLPPPWLAMPATA